MHAGMLAHALDRLAGTARVLYVAAHPDDENTRLLAYLANDRHVTAAYLSMTRGGGGQNLVGTEQGELLDVLRTEELLQARGLDGARQRFTRMRDFGYSKTAAETLAIWDHEQALADVVRVIRTFQPDVVIARFNELPPNHGHHTASAILAREAFAAAGDPRRFPEQLGGGVVAWQPLRLLLNVPNWLEGPPPAGALALDVGTYDARLGLGYAELAARSRSQHKSQGFGVAGERGPIIERFVPLAGTPPSADILDGVALGWERFGPPAAPLGAALERARQLLQRDAPEAALPALFEAQAALAALPDMARVRDARADLAPIIAAAAGLFVRANALQPAVVPGGTVSVRLEIAQRRPAGLVLRAVEFPGATQSVGEPLVLNGKRELGQDVREPADAPVTTPYWLARPAQPGRQVVDDATLIGAPQGPPALAVTVVLGLGEQQVRLPVPVTYSWTDPVQGERTRPFLIVPPATLTPTRAAFLLPNGKHTAVTLRVRAGQDELRGTVSLPLPAGWRCEPSSRAVELAKLGDETTVELTVSAPAGAAPIEIAPVLEANGARWSFREDVIDYPHVPMQVVLQPGTVRLVPLAIALPAGLVGYIAGSGDTVAEDLAHLGMSVAPIDDATLRAGDLSRYRAIVVGIRAYNTRPAVHAAHERLMRYVFDGGTLVVQYNTNNRLAPLDVPIGPYPLTVGRDRITDETAAMEAVTADEPLLRTPNRIAATDFDGWVQERGLYYAEKWDDRYRPIFRSHDPDEAPLLGGTLVADYGKGRYVYTGLAFFRQLPAGVPGAYRLFANLLAPPEPTRR
ncbi:MAG: PIG-L family deacetylase [Deltaproteobacteria bacterium]|nr:PIG-L family deacetylase [Deltaproteobacteria bacterium]